MGNGGSKSKEEADNVKLSLKDLQDVNPFLQDYNEELFKIKIKNNKNKKNQFKHIQPLPVFVSIFFAIILFILIIFNLFTAYMYIKK